LQTIRYNNHTSNILILTHSHRENKPLPGTMTLISIYSTHIVNYSDQNVTGIKGLRSRDE